MEYNFEEMTKRYLQDEELRSKWKDKVNDQLKQFKENKISYNQLVVNISLASSGLSKNIVVKVLEDYHKSLMEFLKENSINLKAE